jgi:sialidase-1
MNHSRWLTLGILAAIAAHDVAGADDVLFRTSFEHAEDATFHTLKDGIVELTATGTAGITSRFARTGKQCLHMLGDKNNSVTFVLPVKMQSLKGVSFHAERWTSRTPFAFSVEVKRGGVWQEVAKLDRVVEVGKRFRSHIQLPIDGKQNAEALRFRVTAATKSGLLIDDLSLHASAPKQPTSIPPNVMPSEPLQLASSQTLFMSGSKGTHTFRIPAIVTATNGDLIAACDARRKGSADLIHQRTIDIVFRRSVDNGKTWSAMETLDQIDDGGCSDPSLLVDEMTGDIFCFYNYMSSDKSNKEFRFVLQKSSDHGKSWGKPVDFTDQVAPPELKNSFKFVTSGRGIQTRKGLLIHNYVRVGKGVTLIASRDHGATWEAMAEVSPGDESKIVQLHDGSLMVNSRIAAGKRYVHRSLDGGKTWKSGADFGLPDPRCNACIVQYTSKQDGYARNRLIFCNAASIRGRRNLAVRISYDGGHTWSAGKVIDRGPSAYSEITILKDGSFGVLFEPGYKDVRFVRFTHDALTGGTDQLKKPYAASRRKTR